MRSGCLYNEHEKPVRLEAKKKILVKSAQEYAIIIMRLQKQFAPMVSKSFTGLYGPGKFPYYS